MSRLNINSYQLDMQDRIAIVLESGLAARSGDIRRCSDGLRGLAVTVVLSRQTRATSTSQPLPLITTRLDQAHNAIECDQWNFNPEENHRPMLVSLLMMSVLVMTRKMANVPAAAAAGPASVV